MPTEHREDRCHRSENRALESTARSEVAERVERQDARDDPGRGSKQPVRVGWPADDASTGQDDETGADQHDRCDPAERPESAGKRARVPTAEHVCTEGRTKREDGLEPHYRQEQHGGRYRCDRRHPSHLQTALSSAGVK